MARILSDAARLPEWPDSVVLRGQTGGIAIGDAAPAAVALVHLAGDWPLADSPIQQTTIRVRGEAGAWRIATDAYDAPDHVFGDVYPLANGIVGTLIGALAVQAPETLVLHAGAVARGPVAVLLLGDNFAGKSSLALSLTAAGARFVSDDRTLLTLEADKSPMLRGLGIAAKMRLPLPNDLAPAIAPLCAAGTYLDWPDLRLLRPADSVRVPAFDSIEIGAIALLDRAESAVEPGIEALAPAAALGALLALSFAPHLASPTLLARLKGLVSAVPCWRARYASASAIAPVLMAALAGR